MLIAAAIAVMVALLVAYWPASRGHWSALAIAIPGLIGGLAILGLFAGPHSDLAVKAVASVPTLLAIGAIALWSRRRKTTRE